MRLFSLFSVAWLFGVDRALSPQITSCFAALIFSAASSAVPALADEACDATADASAGGKQCTPKGDEGDSFNDHLVDDDRSNSNIQVEDSSDDDDDGDGYDDYDDDGDDDSTDLTDPDDESSEDEEGPIWWDYSIDQLFEDYFDCGSIIYGYEFADDETDDDYSGDDSEGDSNNDDQDGKKSKRIAENPEVVSEGQMQHIRRQWAAIREKYVREVNLVPVVIHKARDDLPAREGGEVTDIGSRGVSAVVVPARIGDAGPGKGRGLFATEPISRGTLVIDLENGSAGIFKEGHAWREFAVSLPRETACNFIEWSWVQTIPPRNEIDDDVRNGLTILVAFDESNLMNSADWDDVEANVRCGSPPLRKGSERGPCRFHYYAAHDIAAGEELLINYSEFEDVSQQGWIDIGL